MSKKRNSKNYLRTWHKYVIGILAWLLIVGIFHTTKPLPNGIDMVASSTGDVEFLYDITYDGQSEQEIFDAVYKHIDKAEKYILIDMFLYNPHLGAGTAYRPLSEELTDKLLEKRKLQPEVRIDLITDPINNVYGGDYSEQLADLEDAGVNVIITDLTRLRDSNPLYSPVWRTFIQWFGNSEKLGVLPHPFASGEKVTFRTYLRLVNFKANHRKTFLADHGDTWVSIIASANPHDGSSAHSNVAWKITGDFASQLYDSEKAVARFSDGILQMPSIEAETVGEYNVKLLTERRIRDELINQIGLLGDDDELKMGMFYLSDRKVIKALLDASERGVDIMIVLDPNKDAFGHEKNGVPNRPVAHELVSKSDGRIKIRWYDTQGEQFHSKIIYMKGKHVVIILGSANLTKRNIGNLNLETDVMVTADDELDAEVRLYFDRIWQDGYSLPYSAYEDDSFWHMLMYRVQEFTGLCSF